MEKRQINSGLKFVLDMGPIASFMAAYYMADLLVATATLMVVTFISLLVTYAIERTVAIAPLVTGVLVGVFGAITLLTQDEYFIKIKPTVANLTLAAILLGGVALGKPLLKYVLEVAFRLSEEGWRGLSIRWGLFFIFLAIVNEVVWRNFSTEFWVNFKLFGMLTMNIAFWVIHAPYIMRHKLPDE